MLMPPPPPPPDKDLKPAPQFDVHGYVLECLQKGSTSDQIRKQLVVWGHSADDASTIVQSVVRWRNEQYARQGVDLDDPDSIRSAGKRNMLIGGGLCLLGLVVTIGSCMAAANQGGSFIVTGGLIVWGAVQFFRGAAQAGTGRVQ